MLKCWTLKHIYTRTSQFAVTGKLNVKLVVLLSIFPLEKKYKKKQEYPRPSSFHSFSYWVLALYIGFDETVANTIRIIMFKSISPVYTSNFCLSIFHYQYDCSCR